ncbi:precorrin-6A synthase (deacetylating) [Rhodospirillum rubrum]|uniref:Precorrin-6A synthase [deacetylating] n=1 Tax=Rhodospirillum rubrum (strain ATCC 11170 / ATH 1.1.1 / DSM 467 / LMG 4362 / NCIMB 8255 / S1) TaxID=269796 RepID=Q2RQ30_RHORT|nr:precorrin-6A synthase (deacetylating) [Rhodospirillum rubrum]ABC23765.1 precorrin-6A synthase (deacetylating) [Rhodospirillum rubrum ATCC 11170]AEO49505.1 precorrin 6A synthase [Rhodospirillum rubrum F11]MBK5955446.1 precorrin-6A synthase (deacetylating) [Rhodospirillum rubrum]QXG79717.1 precorrin-6A synthase (deacetylating) [Rhodospirillum rubrum]HAP99340.1 precorrin-6A synthase (deacetylating) [Rhodospirillum rubrum]
MRHVSIIGIGPGDPDCLTLRAARRIAEVDVFFFLDKVGRGKDELLALRRTILDRHATPGRYRVVTVPSPVRDTSASYRDGVEDWYAERLAIFRRLITDELTEEGHGAFLVWGDPGLYDGTLQILARLSGEEGASFDYDVLPGITAVQALAARHRIPLNRIGESIEITTGRRLETADPASLHNSVVLLDGNATFQRFTQTDLEIYWGAYLGTPDEILISGPLAETSEAILARRERARQAKGWIMDTYILRKPEDEAKG